VESGDRLIECALRLYDEVMVTRKVGIERNAKADIWVLKRGKPPRIIRHANVLPFVSMWSSVSGMDALSCAISVKRWSPRRVGSPPVIVRYGGGAAISRMSSRCAP